MSARWQRVMGTLLSSTAFAYVAWGVMQGSPSKSPVGPLVFAGLILGGGASLLWNSRARKRPLRSGGAALEQQILFLAKDRHGLVTAAEIAAESDFTFEDVQKELDRLATSETCELIVTDEGLCVYKFNGFADDEASTEQRMRALRSAQRS